MVQIGRVVTVIYGEDYGKSGVILDVADHNRVLVQGPGKLGLERKLINLKRLRLHSLLIPKLPRQARTATLQAKIDEFQLLDKLAATPLLVKIEKQNKRAAATDFDRFKIMLVKKKRSAAVHKEFAKSGSEELRRLAF